MGTLGLNQRRYLNPNSLFPPIQRLQIPGALLRQFLFLSRFLRGLAAFMQTLFFGGFLMRGRQKLFHRAPRTALGPGGVGLVLLLLKLRQKPGADMHVLLQSNLHQQFRFFLLWQLLDPCGQSRSFGLRRLVPALFRGNFDEVRIYIEKINERFQRR